jgi:RES domain-containing protein
MVYTSATLSLAVLEHFVNLEPEDSPGSLVTRSAEIPESLGVERLDIRKLPRNWRSYPAPEELADIGTEWTRSRRTAVLCVPSAVIPEELNYLLNPAHQEFHRIRINPAVPFRYDPRVWKTRPLG